MNRQAESAASSYKNIWDLSWPLILMMFFQFALGFLNVYVAGRMGMEVQASVGMVTQTMFFFLIVGIALANGGVAAVSQSLGACLIDRATRYVGLCLTLGLGFSLAVTALALIFIGPFLGLLQVPEAIRHIAAEYLAVNLLSLPANYLMIITNSVFRAGRRVRLQLYSAMLLTVINVIGDFGLGLGWFGFPALGYKGLAWSSFTAVHVAAVFNCWLLYRIGWLKRAAFPPMRWVRAAWPYLVKVAWPAGIMQVLWQTGYLVLFGIAASLPVSSVTALAAMTAGNRTEAILFLPAFAFNMTASILVGHALGAGRRDEARRQGLRVLGLGCVFTSLLAAVVWQIRPEVAAVLSTDPAVQAETVRYLSWNLAAIPFTAVSMILGGALTGAGATIYNLSIFGGAVWLIRLPLAWGLGHHSDLGASGIWMSMLISQGVQAGVILFVYLTGNWYRFAMIRKTDGRKECDSNTKI